MPFTWHFDMSSWVLTHRRVDLPGGIQRCEGHIRDLHPLELEAANERNIWITSGGDVDGQFTVMPLSVVGEEPHGPQS